MEVVEEKLLLKRAIRGDTDAFEQLIVPHQKKVYNIALNYFHNPDDALDIMQESLLKAFRSIMHFEGNSSFSTWLYKITTNTCIDKFRKEKKNQVIYVDEDILDDENNPYSLQLKSNDVEPEEAFLQKEMHALLMEMLNQIPLELKTVVILREIHNFNYDEISQLLDLPLGTVKSRLSRGREILRKNLSRTELFKEKVRLFKEKGEFQ